jgi:hypothetical protein
MGANMTNEEPEGCMSLWEMDQPEPPMGLIKHLAAALRCEGAKHILHPALGYVDWTDMAQAAIAALRPYMVPASEVEALRARVMELETALIRLRDCDWVVTLPDRMDAVRDIARQALSTKQGEG